MFHMVYFTVQQYKLPNILMDFVERIFNSQ